MRIGILSDIHANYEAFSAVMAAYEEEQIDSYFCGGDIVGYGASPNECVDLIRSTTKDVVVGNHDAAVAGRMDYSYYYEAARQVLDLHSRMLTEDNLAWLKRLHYNRKYPDWGICLCHGSPIRQEEFDYIFAVDQAYSVLPFFEELSPITYIGHSHLCRVFALTKTTVEEIVLNRFTIDPNRKYIISVGSVGQPRDYDNRASYTIFDTDSREFSFKRVEYDIETSASKIFAAKLERNFGNRLFIGV
jgi:predicted phosphodiesterase